MDEPRTPMQICIAGLVEGKTFDEGWALMRSCMPSGDIVLDTDGRIGSQVKRSLGEYDRAVGVYAIRGLEEEHWSDLGSRAESGLLYVGKAGTLTLYNEQARYLRESCLGGRISGARYMKGEGRWSAKRYYQWLEGEYGSFRIEWVAMGTKVAPALAEAALLNSYANEHDTLPELNKVL